MKNKKYFLEAPLESIDLTKKKLKLARAHLKKIDALDDEMAEAFDAMLEKAEFLEGKIGGLLEVQDANWQK